MKKHHWLIKSKVDKTTKVQEGVKIPLCRDGQRTGQRPSGDILEVTGNLNPKLHKMETKLFAMPQRHEHTSVWHLHRTQENGAISIYSEL